MLSGGKLEAALDASQSRKTIINKAVSAGFHPAVVTPLLDFLILELADRPSAIQSKYLINGDLIIDVERRIATYRGEIIKLTRVELRVLEYFMRNPEHVLPHGKILKDVWGIEGADLRDPAVANIRVHVNTIRRKTWPGIIKSKTGEGYYLPLQ